MPISPSRVRAAALVALLAAGGSCGADRVPAPSPVDTPPPTGSPVDTMAVVAVRIGPSTLTAEVASTAAQRARGLMGRQRLSDSAGMLFVFGRDGQLGFWMKDTPIDLSIAFLDADRRILNIEQMDRFDDRTTHYSAGPARYALEVNRGWFAARGIGVGDLVEFTLPTGLRIDP